ncbi:MAG: sugar ABC transporter substrate-binding protein [Acidobacteriia bacterium]|nr:sugar ABC transporter substrate-binding protein [Terriglobia bacterium]
MKKPRFLLSLTNDDNDYQIEQTSAAQQAARKLGVELQIVYAGNDGIVQSQQLLSSIHSTNAPRPDAIIFEPAGSTAHPQVVRAAAAAGIGVVLLNSNADYISELRRHCQVPVFAITSNHEEIGRIQGRQVGALLPAGGIVLYIQGPSDSSAAKQRYTGFLETKPENVQLRALKAHWTEASAHKTVSSFLCLSTSRQAKIEAVCAQDDSMAMGARKAFEECSELRKAWQKMAFLGCDGLPKTGQEWVRSNLLTATIFIPPNADQAIEMMVKSIASGVLPPERTFTIAKSFPAVEVLIQSARARGAARG